MRAIQAVVVATSLASPAFLLAQAPVDTTVKQAAYARVTLAHAVASDPEILKAVAAKNVEGESQQAIERKDREWRTTRAPLPSPSSSASPSRRAHAASGPCRSA